MKNNFEAIDKLIKENLTAREAKLYDDLEEQTVFKMILNLYSGKNSWLLVLMSVLQILFFILFVYCGIKFFNTNTTNELIKWCVLGFCSIMVSLMLKLYAWIEMNKKATVREIKRLQILISSISR
ncbi:DUF6768 family protein [Tenacibaculum sp. UWU-22]|uniref:DUF6768 family protein n=1 Tax=Tenacibaculum sp. UWU-22 TaxID=3234187 RepID=UPI0034DB1A1A